MKNNPINLTIPPGARVMSIGFGESHEESDNDIRAAFKRAEERGSASIPLREQSDDVEAAPTVIDKLRMRGTPLELIYSYLIADSGQASGAFRSCLLEAVHERLTGAFKESATVRFDASNNLEKDNDVLRKRFEAGADDIFFGLGLTPRHDDDLVKKGSTVGFATLHTVEPQDSSVNIGDDAQSTILGEIDRITEFVEQTVVDRCVQVVSKHGQGHFTIGIVPECCKASIGMTGTAIKTSARIGIYVYFIKPAD